MQIAIRLGLEVEVFARMCLRTKMLLSNILGHAAESHYEKYLNNLGQDYVKAPTDSHFDYTVGQHRDQVKRFESQRTNQKRLAINLTQTHGDRSGEGAFYEPNSFDRLIAYDVLFRNFHVVEIEQIPRHPRFETHLGSHLLIPREANPLVPEQLEVLNLLKVKNEDFPRAVDEFLGKHSLTFAEGLSYLCNLSLSDIDGLFSRENFRLVTGAKGFAAEEHFNVYLEDRDISYRQDRNMYSKVDHWLGELRVQVKIPHQRSVTASHWAFKTHKSHGHGVGELYRTDEFDLVALFIGFVMDEEVDPYLPIRVSNEFIFVPVKFLQEHPDFPGHLKRISRVLRTDYPVNELVL